MDPAIEKILAISDRSFLHDVLRSLCVDNGFVRRVVLEHFTALPDDSSHTDIGGVTSGGQASGMPGKCNEDDSDNQDDVKPETSRGAGKSLYDIPLAPSHYLSVPPPDIPRSPPLHVAAPFRAGEPLVPNGSSPGDAMVVDDESNHDGSGSVYSGGDFHDGDADTIYHSGADDDDADLSSSSDEEPSAPLARRLTPTVFSTREYARQADFVSNKTRLNLYKAIYDHIAISENIEDQTERLMDCKDPARIERMGARLHRLEQRRLMCRQAIENVLAAEDRDKLAEMYEEVAATADATGTGAAQKQKKKQKNQTTRARAAAPADREADIQARAEIERRLAGMRAEQDKARRMSKFLVAAKQAAKRGAQRLKRALDAEAREAREVGGRRSQGRTRRSAASASGTPSEVGGGGGGASGDVRA